MARQFFCEIRLYLPVLSTHGAASFISQPGKRVGYALTEWVELKKQ